VDNVGIAASLYEVQYDFPSYSDIPKTELMIAAIPRSGSTMFCTDLWETGVLGAPLEYLNFSLMQNIPRWRAALERPTEYWRAIKRVRTAPSGVFSYKMLPSVYQQLADTSQEWLSEIAPSRIIYFTREDIDAQAISYSKAIQSDAWFADVPERQSPQYSFAHIADCKELLLRQMADWERICKFIGSDVLRVTYEDVLRSKDAVIARVLAFVTGHTHREYLSIPRIRIQRNSASAEWCAQLAEDLVRRQSSTSHLDGKRSNFPTLSGQQIA
jgi:LPS sulfotransferase NodH